MPVYTLKRTQQIASSIDDVWAFVSAPKNLREITPEYMGFEVVTPDLPEEMYAGMLIQYRVSPILGVKMTWVTEITHIKDRQYFVDEQRVGPYSMWHHQHHLVENDDGVLMTDIIDYRPPLWFFGAIANTLFIRRQLDEIFDFRREALEKRFPGF